MRNRITTTMKGELQNSKYNQRGKKEQKEDGYVKKEKKNDGDDVETDDNKGNSRTQKSM